MLLIQLNGFMNLAYLKFVLMFIAAGSLLGSPAVFAEIGFDYEVLFEAEVPDSGNASKLAYKPGGSVVAVLNSAHGTIDFYRVSFTRPALMIPCDLGTNFKGIKTDYSPTGVAMHPSNPFVIWTAAESMAGRNGKLFAAAAANDNTGDLILDQDIAQRPSAVAISPDGRFAVVGFAGQKDQNNASLAAFDISSINIKAKPYQNRQQPIEIGSIADFTGTAETNPVPKVIKFSPSSGTGAVVCPSSDTVVLLSTDQEPKFAAALKLPAGSDPAGVDIIDISTPGNKLLPLVAIAERGRKHNGSYMGQSVSLFSLDETDPQRKTKLLSRIDVNALLFGKDDDVKKRCYPADVSLEYFRHRLLCFVCLYHQDKLLCMDITVPFRPRKIGTFKTGDAPSNIYSAVKDDEIHILIANESTRGESSITMARFAPKIEKRKSRLF